MITRFTDLMFSVITSYLYTVLLTTILKVLQFLLCLTTGSVEPVWATILIEDSTLGGHTAPTQD
jgi:hypothetical protein